MAWIFFVPRGSVYFAVSVVGGAAGFAFIFLVPLLAHWKSTDNTVLLEQRLNLAAQQVRKSKGLRKSEYSNRGTQSETDDDESSSWLQKLWILFFLVTGVSCLVLPIVANFGILVQP